jgi:hypothetical protein
MASPLRQKSTQITDSASWRLSRIAAAAHCAVLEARASSPRRSPSNAPIIASRKPPSESATSGVDRMRSNSSAKARRRCSVGSFRSGAGELSSTSRMA